MSQYSHICLLNNMVMKDEHGKLILDENDEVQIDMKEFRRLKAKISMSLEETHREREKQITLLSEKFPTFATHSAVKVFSAKRGC